MNRDLYARRWSATSPRLAEVKNAQCIPANLERREHSAPCTYCGVRPDVPCNHKMEAA